MPVYNGKKYPPEAIDSVINQTFKNWKLLVINDHPSDNSKKTTLEYASKELRIKVVDNKEKVLPKGINHSRFLFHYFLKIIKEKMAFFVRNQKSVTDPEVLNPNSGDIEPERKESLEKNRLISVCIPTYEMDGKAKEVLTRSFDMFKKQTYKNFEVVISDNSEDDAVKNLCEEERYSSLPIRYFRNPVKGMAQNTNESIKRARGDIIKILYMDDYLANENSLKRIAESFKGYWLVTGCKHDNGNRIFKPHYPSYDDKIRLGKNTIGSPSVLSIKNENPLLFDEKMTWVLDCDYYKRMYDKYGEPEILNEINVVIGLSKEQVTNILPESAKKAEEEYIMKKYK